MPLRMSLIGELDPEHMPDGPCVILTGDRESVREAAALFGRFVTVAEADDQAPAGWAPNAPRTESR